jgi:hypothetical protein
VPLSLRSYGLAAALAACGPPPGLPETADDPAEAAGDEAVPPPERSWAELVPDGHGFRVELPGRPEVDVHQTATANATVVSFEAVVADDGLRASVQYHEVTGRGPEVEDEAAARDPHERLRDAIVDVRSAWTAFEEHRLELAGQPGIEVKLRGSGRGADYEMWVRSYLVGSRVYRIVVRPIGARPPSDFASAARRILDSFSLVPE